MTKPEIIRRLSDAVRLLEQLVPVVRHMPASSSEVGTDVRDLELSIGRIGAELAETADQMMANRYSAHNHRQAILTGTVQPRGGHNRLEYPLSPGR